MLGIKPIGWTVLCEEFDRSEITSLIIPDSNKEVVFKKWVVLAVGEPHIAANGREVPIPVEVGDEVWIDLTNPSKYHTIPPQFMGGRIVFVADCSAIKAVLTGKPEPMSKPIVRANRMPELVH